MLEKKGTDKMESTAGKAIYNGFLEVAKEKCGYFAQWTYDTPIAITTATNQKLHKIQKLLYKCIRYFVENYEAFYELMPVSDQVRGILSLFQEKPYRTGTYRTDFVVGEQNEIKLIEITCRFAMNGFFTTGFFRLLSERFLQYHPEIRKVDDYTPYFDYIAGCYKAFDRICLLKGVVEKNEDKIMIPIFEAAKYPVFVLRPDEISAGTHLFENSLVMSQLSHEEICSLPMDTIRAIRDANLINDYRTVFLIHDKRFLSVLSKESFLDKVLTAREKEEFLQYLVPTYQKGEREDLWQAARHEKEKWIIKPSVLGRSIDIFAGCVTADKDWAALFEKERTDIVLQEYISQRRFRGRIGEQSYNDYAVGTLLFFDDHFFGPGMFRTSSHPVTNITDDRKMAFVVTDDTECFSQDNVL